jgi:hypothetical protein
MRKQECIFIDCRKGHANIPYDSWVPIIRLGALKKKSILCSMLYASSFEKDIGSSMIHH